MSWTAFLKSILKFWKNSGDIKIKSKEIILWNNTLRLISFILVLFLQAHGIYFSNGDSKHKTYSGCGRLSYHTLNGGYGFFHQFFAFQNCKMVLLYGRIFSIMLFKALKSEICYFTVDDGACHSWLCKIVHRLLPRQQIWPEYHQDNQLRLTL